MTEIPVDGNPIAVVSAHGPNCGLDRAGNSHERIVGGGLPMDLLSLEKKYQKGKDVDGLLFIERNHGRR